jgi:hypothetical protein
MQFIEEASHDHRKHFRCRTLVPGGPIRVFGFVVRDTLDELGAQDRVAVYVPQSYNFAGSLFVAPRDQIEPLRVAISDLMAFIVISFSRPRHLECCLENGQHGKVLRAHRVALHVDEFWQIQNQNRKTFTKFHPARMTQEIRVSLFVKSAEHVKGTKLSAQQLVTRTHELSRRGARLMVIVPAHCLQLVEQVYETLHIVRVTIVDDVNVYCHDRGATHDARHTAYDDAFDVAAH